MTKVEQFEAIRKDYRDGNTSIRDLARKHKVHRRKVREALASAQPASAKATDKQAPVLGPWRGQIRSWLIADKEIHRKQRHSAHRIWRRLVDEYGVDVGESTVRNYVATLRKELADNVAGVPIVQLHAPGAEAEVDFGEFYAWIDDEYTKVQMFAMRLSSSAKAFHRASVNCSQGAFLDGHVRAFEYFGGVPRRIRYDNLKPAVTRVMTGRSRQESDRFVVLRSHFGFDSFFCLPGIKGAHEKGGVEGEIGRFRRNHLVPVPSVKSMAELNRWIEAADIKDDDRHVDHRLSTVRQDFDKERSLLSPLPTEGFDVTEHLKLRVDAKARVVVRQCRYSVPVRLVGSFVDVRLGADSVEVRHNGIVLATHPRLIKRNAESLNIDHYLETLVTKPGAFAGSFALCQARASGAFSSTHDEFWQMARRNHGDSVGTKAVIEVLLLHRNTDSEAVKAGMWAAMSIGSTDPNVVAIEARRHLEPGLAQVVPIDAALSIKRQVPDVGGYDELLRGEQ